MTRECFKIGARVRAKCLLQFDTGHRMGLVNIYVGTMGRVFTPKPDRVMVSWVVSGTELFFWVKYDDLDLVGGVK